MNGAKPTTDILKTKQHYDILDGLRGVAALSIVVFHFMEIVYSDYSKNFIGHGFLAVDFFFCLSGFVIAYAYDDRIGKMGIAEFFKSRLIRLHPMVILGSVLGLLGFLFDPFGGHPELYRVGKIVLFFLTSIFLIPFPVMSERGFNLFSFNAPAWSLFWEYVANIVYAFALSKLNRRWLLVLAVPAAVWLYLVAHRVGGLMGGWAGFNFWDGCARISYSFLAGMLVFRFKLILKTRFGFLGMALLLLLAFFMPYFSINWLAELLVVLLYFPLVVALGAGATLTPAFKKLCVLFGKISYPLYMVHYAGIWIFFNYHTSHKLTTGQLAVIVTTGVIVLVCIAYVAMLLYDIPVRKYLSSKRKQGI